MTSEHTPGPWIVDDEGNVCLPNGSGMIAWVSSPDDIDVCGESPESLANARLIAAAPDMLAALNCIVERSAFPDVYMPIVRAAIAKAAPPEPNED